MHSRSSSLPIALAFFGFGLVGLAGGANGVLLPSLSAFYHVGDGVIGLLFLLSSLGYFLSALSSSLFTERIGLRWFLILGATAVFLGLFPFALQMPFWLLLTARLLVGFGVGMIETGLNVYITSLPRHTGLLNSLHAFYGVGGLLGPLLASTILASQWGWQHVYLLLAGLNLLLIPSFVISFGSLYRRSSSSMDEEPIKENVLGATLKLPIIWIATLFLLIYVGIEVSVGNWSYSFLLEARHQGTLLAGWVVSGFWLGLTIGRFTLHRLAERLGISTKKLMSICLAGIALSLVLIWLLPLSTIAAIGFCLIGLCLAPIYPLTVAIAPTLVPTRLGPSAIGLLVSVSIIGLALFPWIAGIVAQFFGIWTLLPYMLGLTIVLIGVWYVLTRHASMANV